MRKVVVILDSFIFKYKDEVQRPEVTRSVNIRKHANSQVHSSSSFKKRSFITCMIGITRVVKDPDSII